MGSGSGELFFPVRMLVVEGGVESKVFGDPGALVIAAGDADDATTVNLADLSNDAAGSASGGGDNERFTILRRSDFHAEECGESVDAENSRKTVSETKGILGTFWKVRLDSSRMT